LTQAGELPPYDHLLPTTRPSDDRFIIYVRKAIPDHGVPHSAQAMAEILDYLEIALEVGHRVYLHCRAGIGRTNTVAGCWLRRCGYAGIAALTRLNELWRANGRAVSWPQVPETTEQKRYVLEWREPHEEFESNLNLDAARALRDRYAGCLLGLACGDALGATLQFRKPGSFVPVHDLKGGGPWLLPQGAWTDDTAMSVCVAESLLAHEGCDTADQLQRYRRWQESGEYSSTGQCVGITGAVAAALAGVHVAANAAAPADAQALTRAGAVVLFAASSPERVLGWVAAAVAVTHRSRDVAAAAQYYAALLLAAIRGATRANLRAAAQALLPRGASGKGPAFEAAETILHALQGSSGFREGLLQIVNCGGDADIHGALFGQLAGALYGARGIPKAWRRTLQRRAMLEELADRLLAAALTPRE
jgi:ADP-ribosylglycohydrolase